MTHTKDEALKLALEALEAETDPNWECNSYHPKIWEAITAIKQALAAQPAPVQPVQKKLNGWWAHTNPETGLVDVVNYQLTQADKAHGWFEQEIYTTPPAATQPAVPLTKDEALKLALEALEGIHPGNMTPMAEEYWNKAITFCKQALAAQPAIPDVIHHTDLSEHPQYIEGWNDCRASGMLKGMKP